jgi:hypothetical protein
MRTQPFKSNRIENGYAPGPFAGCRNWMRFHRKNGTPPTKIKGDPDRYLHSTARSMNRFRKFLEDEWSNPFGRGEIR